MQADEVQEQHMATLVLFGGLTLSRLSFSADSLQIDMQGVALLAPGNTFAARLLTGAVPESGTALLAVLALAAMLATRRRGAAHRAGQHAAYTGFKMTVEAQKCGGSGRLFVGVVTSARRPGSDARVTNTHQDRATATTAPAAPPRPATRPHS